MHALLTCDFRVERGGQQLAGAHCNNSSQSVQSGGVAGVLRVNLCQDFDSRANPFHPRSTDEDRVHRIHAGLPCAELESFEIEVGFKGLALPPEGIAAHRDVQSAKGLLGVSVQISSGIGNLIGKENHAGTRAVHRKAFGDALPKRVREFKDSREFVDRGGFPTRDDQAVNVIQFCGPTDAHTRGACGFHCVDVLTEVALEGQYADPESCTHA